MADDPDQIREQADTMEAENEEDWQRKNDEAQALREAADAREDERAERDAQEDAQDEERAANQDNLSDQG